jgi:hypothetical protein
MRRHPVRFLLAIVLAEGFALAALVLAWNAGLVSDAAFPWAAIGIVAAFSPLLAAAALAMPRARQAADRQPPRRSARSSARGSRPSR